MPQRIHYTIRIANQHTSGSVWYDALDLAECACAINRHYGLHDPHL